MDPNDLTNKKSYFFAVENVQQEKEGRYPGSCLLPFFSTHKFHTALEKQFYAELEDKTGIDLAINFNPLDVVGIDMQDTLRMVRTGAFDIVQSTVGAAARDDAFLEGIDLIGVSTSYTPYKAV